MSTAFLITEELKPTQLETIEICSPENILIDVSENPKEYKYFRRIYLNQYGLEYPYETDSYIEIICIGEEKLEFTVRIYKNHITFPIPLSNDNIVDEIKVYVYE